MIDRLSLLCFGGTYALSLIADLSRVRWGGRASWRAVVGFLGLGWLVHAVYLINHGISEGRFPVSTMFGRCVVSEAVVSAFREPRDAGGEDDECIVPVVSDGG